MLLVAVFVLCAPALSYTQPANYYPAPSLAVSPDFIRLHVVANSNSPTDQLCKANVRQATVQLLAAQVQQVDDADAALRLVQSMSQDVQDQLGQYLVSTGIDYGVQVSVGQHDFPAKSYGGTITPPGSYSALRITLGDGRGDNWWCVLFPPLCLVDAGVALPSPSAAFGWHEDSQDLMVAIEALAAQRQPQLRSWLVELLVNAGLWADTKAGQSWLPLGEQP